MLLELFIRNFAIIDEIRIQFDEGLNVLTGETGAGKSIILDAMALVLGERADTTMVRSGSEIAYVEASFRLDTKMHKRLNPIIIDEGLEGDSEYHLLLSRELRLSGRNICRINGRAASLTLQKKLGEMLVDIHGQGQHLTLLRPRSHLPLLDAYADLDQVRAELSSIVNEVRTIQRYIQNLEKDERKLAQRADLLRYQVDEISTANLYVGEYEELLEERQRLANVEQLLEHTNAALMALNGMDADQPSMGDLLGMAEKATEYIANIDPSMQAFLEKLQGISYQLSDLTGELFSYQTELEYDPGRLGIVEERVELISRLKRKYGSDIAAILSTWEEASAELEQITHSEDRLEQLHTQESELLVEVGRRSELLSKQRQEASRKLAAGIERELADLNMEQAHFDVHFEFHESDDGTPVGNKRLAFDNSGIDQVEFLVSTNPGEEVKPLAKVASGGETSRLMLALKTALARADATPTLIFDEIDQGIGGRIGDVVGRKLWGLTNPASHQVIIVTHLPQLAGYADGHFHVSKRLSGRRTVTYVTRLDGKMKIQELAEMLGTDERHGIETAEALLRQVELNKNN